MDIINTLSNNRLWNKHAIKIVWAISLLFLALVIASIVWTSWTQSNIKKENYQAQKIQQIRQSSGPSYRINDVVSANLFGDPNPAPVVKQAPKTTLDLTLQGILWASDNSMARAIIMSGKRKTELYSVGEKIKGAGASIKEIRNGEVILDRNGALESLLLVKKTQSGNRQLFTYSTPDSEFDNQVSSISQQQIDSMNDGASVQATSKPRSQQGAGRKIRKPNFSGLDRALKKMGEL